MTGPPGKRTRRDAGTEALAARLLGDGRTRLGGLHIDHARRVAAAVAEHGDRQLVAVALLHDVLEKSDTTADQLLALTGDEEMVRLVEVLTKRPGEPDHVYLARCAADPRVLAVKRADLRDKLVAGDGTVPEREAEQVRRLAIDRLAFLDQVAARSHEPRPPGAGREAQSTFVPGVQLLRSYRVGWLRSDVVAGLVLTALLVPQGMAYAELAGLPAITGLYTSILCLVGYALFGPSKILVLGPDSSLGPMIAATILPLVAADGDPARAVALASALALLVGTFTIAAAIGKLGFVADLISKPTIVGYMNGLALTILVGQLPKLFGFSVEADGFRAEVAGFVRGLADGETVGAALSIGVFGLALIIILQRRLPKVPGVLLAVVLSIAAAAVFDLAERGVEVVGVLPQGLPPLTVPDVGLSDIGLLFGGALGIAVVSLADTISTASSFAARSGAEIDGRREMIGIGASNVAAGLFQGFPVSTSGSRTAVAEQAGAKTQLTGLVGAAAIVLILLFVPGLLRDLPQPTLAAVVIAASLSLADVPSTMRLYRVRRTEFLLSTAAFLGVVLLGVLPGIALAVAVSIANVFRQAWWPYQAILGQVPGLPGFHDVTSYPEARRLPGCVIYRFDAPLLFANSRTFREQVRALAATDPPPTWIVVASEPITDVDTTAADMLQDLVETLGARGTRLVFAEMKDPVRHKIQRYELAWAAEPDRFFPTIRAATDAFRERTGATWR